MEYRINAASRQAMGFSIGVDHCPLHTQIGPGLEAVAGCIVAIIERGLRIVTCSAHRAGVAGLSISHIQTCDQGESREGKNFHFKRSFR